MSLIYIATYRHSARRRDRLRPVDSWFQTTQSDKNAILVDGLPGSPVASARHPRLGTDHIELSRGRRVLYGQGQPGGFVNLITRSQPRWQPV